ncbi:MAG: 2-oxoacid:ferredoxin oxidoreductase subunit beta [Acidobacteria bacterium]|nr:2-oxoacid:ferredoxin oxidoreductase subunit beta [Acidobacteriota bacterium]
MSTETPETAAAPAASAASVASKAPLSKKDFQTDQEVRWCPGCGDYAILSAVQQVFPELGIPREKFVVVSGIGCSSRFPYYMNTFGFHSIHGRAPAVATGLKLARPELEVWIATGDGDSMSIGGNHLIHVLRRNVGVKILMFNNRIYGLTKGQYSPTSEAGKRTKSTPFGSIDTPFNPLALALGAGATFVARSVDIFQQHLKETLRRAAQHRGTAFVEIYQNCNIFNDKAFGYMTEKETREEHTVQLEHGKPLVFGKRRNRGIRLRGAVLEAFEIGSEAMAQNGRIDDCLVWDEKVESPALAFLAAQLLPPGLPTALGVLRAVERPSYESGVVEQIHGVEKLRPGKLEDLLTAGDTWTVGEPVGKITSVPS